MEHFEKLAEELRPKVIEYLEAEIAWKNAEIGLTPEEGGFKYPPVDQADMTGVLCALMRLTSATDYEPHSDDTGLYVDFELDFQYSIWVKTHNFRQPETEEGQRTYTDVIQGN